MPDAPTDAGLLQQVRLAALGREYVEVGACPQAAPPATPASAESTPSGAADQADPAALVAQPLAPAQVPGPEITGEDRPWWLGALLALLSLGLVGTIVWELRIRAGMRARLARPRRQGRRPPLDDDALLRQLLDRSKL